MDPVLSLALGALKADESARSKVEPGSHEVDAIVRITGRLTVGVDRLQDEKVSVPLDFVLAHVMGEIRKNLIGLGVPDHEADRVLNGHLNGALNAATSLTETSRKATMDAAGVTDAIGVFVASQKKILPKKKVSGSVSGGGLSVTLVEVDAAKVEAAPVAADNTRSVVEYDDPLLSL